MKVCVQATRTALLLVLAAGLSFPQPGPFDGKTFHGRIAWSADGNHNDEDDWAASPVALAIFAAFGVQNQLVHFDYNSILNNNDPQWAKTHEESVLGAAERFGYDRARFHDCQRNLEAAIDSLAKAINDSSAENPLYLVIAGPMEIAHRAIQQSDPAKRKYVYAISHSNWNDGFAPNYTYNYNKRDVIPSAVKWVQIRDQNAFLSTSPYGRPANPEEWQPFHWMRDSADKNLQFLWQRLRVSTRADCSDAGMAYFLMTGDEESEVSKLRALLEKKTIPAPIDPRQRVRIEAENFMVLDNFELDFNRAYRDVSHRMNVQLNGAAGRMQTPLEQPYTAPSGQYDVEIRYFDGSGGKSLLTFSVNGRRQGDPWQASEDDDAWKSRTIRAVTISQGDEIMVRIERDGNERGRLDYVQLNYASAAAPQLPADASAEAEYFPVPENQGGWRTLVPVNQEPSAGQKQAVREKAGLDWDKLREAWDYCESKSDRNNMVVIRHGWIAGEWRTFESPLGIASSTKSLTAVAMAKLFDLSEAGQLPKRIGPGDFAYQYLPPSWAEEEPARKKIQIRHLMTMSSGLEPYDGPYRDIEAYAKVVVTRKVEAEPGTVWAYASAPVDELSLILENASGKTLRDFIWKHIEDPIGVGPIEWPEFLTHTGASGGPGGGARYTPREMARIGYLMLHKGRWADRNGPKQVLSAERVALLTSWAPFLENAVYRVPNMGVAKPGSQHYYGYLWWNNRTNEALGADVPAGAYFTEGWGRQVCIVVPSLDLVVVRLGPNQAINRIDDYLPQMMTRIMAAITDR